MYSYQRHTLPLKFYCKFTLQSQIHWYKGRYTPGDKLQQHVAATRCSDKSLRV